MVRSFALRSHYWGALLMVVVAGEVDAASSTLLASELRKLQEGNDLIVDLWDVPRIDVGAVTALDTARRRADVAGWGFAIVAEPGGSCAQAIEQTDALKTFASRQAARAALQ
jgi:anti-anti-sigma regulatory factor